ELGSAMDDLINSESRGLKCRRKVPTLYFGNDKRVNDDHKRCDPTDANGCQRCAPRTSRLCCDLCHPDDFAEFAIAPANVAKQKAAPKKSNIKKFDMGAADHNFKRALVVWRQEKAVLQLGRILVRTYGPKVFMSDEIVDRLVECAHAHKLTNVEGIKKETRWRADWAEKYGPSLLELVTAHYPAPAPPATVLRPGALETNLANTATNRSPVVAATTQKRKTIKCSRCNQEGHISTSFISRGRGCSNSYIFQGPMLGVLRD
ncbi:hypothetical protein PLICRDRAFT_114321, partial [Plicaturopsis crispa FD-325 SS-3]